MCGIAISNFPDWSTDLRHSFGWTAGSTQNYSIAFGSDQGGSTTNTFRRAQNDYCFCHGSSGSTTGALIKLKTFDAAGATFTYDRNDSNAYEIPYIAIGGADITNVKAGAFTPTSGTAPYTQDIDTVGFQPDFVFFMGAVTAPPTSPTSTSVAHQAWFQGAAKSSSNQIVMAQASVDSAASSTSNRAQRTDACILWHTPGTADSIDGRASYVGTVATNQQGFRIQWDDAPATRPTNSVFYLAIKGGSWNTGSHNQPTAAAPTTSSVTGLNHTPKGLFLMGYEASAGTDPAFADIKFTWGAATSSAAADNWNVLGGDLDGSDPIQAIRRHTDTYCVASADIDSTPADADLTSQGKLSSFQSGGFTLSWSTTSGTARQLLYVTAGDNTGLAIVKKVDESVGITEPIGKRRTHAQTENVGITEALGRGRARAIVENEGIAEPTPIKLVAQPPANIKFVNESVGITEAKSRRWTHYQTENMGISEFIKPVKTIPKKNTDQSQIVETARGIVGRIRKAPAEVIQNVESKYGFRGLVRKSTLDVVQKIESKYRKVQFYQASITPGHMVFYFSGGVNNQTNTLSIGDARSNYPASVAAGTAGGFMNTGFTLSGFTIGLSTTGETNIWDVVLQSEASPGDTEYRCYYLRNNHTSLTASNIKIWINTNAQRGEIQIGLGASAVNGTETAPANENTAPGSVTFYTPTSETDPNVLTISSLAAGAHKAIWLKRVIPAATLAYLNTTYTLEMSFYTDFQ